MKMCNSVQVAGDHKAMACDCLADCQQVLRHLGETHPTPPLWRQQRPCLHLDSAQALFDTSEPTAQGSVVVRCIVLTALTPQLCCCYAAQAPIDAALPTAHTQVLTTTECPALMLVIHYPPRRSRVTIASLQPTILLLLLVNRATAPPGHPCI